MHVRMPYVLIKELTYLLTYLLNFDFVKFDRLEEGL